MARTKKSNRATALLERYMRKALGPDFDDEVFSPSPHLMAPTLIEGQTSHILIYRGCFIPLTTATKTLSATLFSAAAPTRTS